VGLAGAGDLHVQFNEPGRSHWEGWGWGSRAVAAGGVTTVVEMRLNALPPTTTTAAFQAKVTAAQASSVVDFALWGGLITDNLSHLPALASAGVIGFKAFMCPTGTPEFTHVEDGILYEGLCRIRELGLFLGVHAESHWITQHNTERLQAQDRTDRRAWAEARPRVSFLQPFIRIAEDGVADGTLRHLAPAQATADLLFNTVCWSYVHLRGRHGWKPEATRKRVIALALEGMAA